MSDDLRTGLARAIGDSVARHDEGEEPRLFELLDYSGENKARLVMLAAADAALSHFTAHLESNAMVERVLDSIGPFDFHILQEQNYGGEHREWKEPITEPRGGKLTRTIARAVIAAQVAAMKGTGA